jgi:hypothetical protein
MSTTIRQNLVPLESLTGAAGVKGGGKAIVRADTPEQQPPVARAAKDQAIVNAAKGSAIAVVPAILVGKAVQKHLSTTGTAKVLASLGHTEASFLKLTGKQAGATLQKFIAGRMVSDIKANNKAWAVGVAVVGIAASATYLASMQSQAKAATTP